MDSCALPMCGAYGRRAQYTIRIQYHGPMMPPHSTSLSLSTTGLGPRATLFSGRAWSERSGPPRIWGVARGVPVPCTRVEMRNACFHTGQDQEVLKAFHAAFFRVCASRMSAFALRPIGVHRSHIGHRPSPPAPLVIVLVHFQFHAS